MASVAMPARADEALRVEDAVALALSRNERAKISDANVVVADAAVLKARTPFYPTVTVTGAYTQAPNDLTAAGKTCAFGGSCSYTDLASVVVNQPLFVASSFPLLAQAKRLLDGQVAQTVDDKRLLAYNAAQAFFACLSADAVVAAANTQLDTAKANLTDTQDRAENKLVSTNDVTRAQIDLANAVHEVENDKGVAQVAYVTLAFTINAPVPTKLATPTTLLEAGRADIPPVEGLVQKAIALRPDLVSKRYLATAAHDFADEPMLRLVPSLGLAGTFALSSAQTIPGHDVYNNEFLVLTLTWPLFDAGVRYSDKRSRDGLATVADLTTSALVRAVDADVRSAVYTLKAAQIALGAAEQARDAARRSALETEVLYKQSLAKAIELVDANDTRFLADVTYATSEYAVALAYLALRQAIGLDPIGTDLR
jgi:outer membrane protein TolC